MDDPPTPSSTDSQSRRGSHIDTHVLDGVEPHPKHVQFRRESHNPPTGSGSLHRNSKVAINIGDFIFKSKDKMHREREVHEASPLMAPTRKSEDSDTVPALAGVSSPASVQSWNAEEGARQETRSTWYLFLLTICIGGLQVVWSVELSNGSPYLLSLGISKSLLALVWIAGPLSGTLVQPYVGIKSDRCRSRFGKRRPFMVGGAAATIISLMLLAWTKEIMAGFLHIFGVAKDSEGTKIAAIVFATLMVYVLDFSINVIQAGIRAFIVDNSPTHQQEDANAWASRMTGAGNILGCLAGYVNLPKYFWWLGDTQFKVLSVFATVAIVVTLAISCISIKERDPRLEGEPSHLKGGVFAFFKDLWRSLRNLPPQISRVCQVQFFAWIGWFPFLFYITTYIGEIYVEPFFEENPHMTEAEIAATWARGTRVGTFALFIFAIATFASNVFLPFIVASTYKAPEPSLRTPLSPAAERRNSLGGATNDPAAVGVGGYFPAHTAAEASARHGILRRMWARIPSLEIKWLTLRRTWMISHILFALMMWLTFAVKTTWGATVLTAAVGVPWAVTCWAPFALIAAEISKRDSIRRGLLRPPPTEEGARLASGDDPSEGADQAGVVLGIHNVAIAAPQIIATLVSSVIFKALQKPRGSVGDNSVAWVLRFGGICAVVAAWMTRRVFEERQL